MIGIKDIEFVESILGLCNHNARLVAYLDDALDIARAWVRAPDAVRKTPFKDMETALSIGREWEKSSSFKGKRPVALLEPAIAAVRLWRGSRILKKEELPVILEAVTHMGTWNRDRRFNKYSPQILFEAHKAFKGKSPTELKKGDILSKAREQSSVLKGKSQQQFNEIVVLYGNWYTNKHIFKNAVPEFLARAEVLAGEWKKVFSQMGVKVVIQAHQLITEWDRNPVLNKEKPSGLEKALGLAKSWNAATRLRVMKAVDVEAAVIWIKEISGAPEAPLFFDGHTLYWRQAGRDTSWPAYSGKEDYWKNDRFWPSDQGKEDKGPIPEGIYAVGQNEFQIRKEGDLLEAGKQRVGKWLGKKMGQWPGNYTSWGDQRVWLLPKEFAHPDVDRDKFSIHGGVNPGSAGCIDLVDRMPEFADRFRLYGRDMELTVRYPFRRMKMEPHTQDN